MTRPLNIGIDLSYASYSIHSISGLKFQASTLYQLSRPLLGDKDMAVHSQIN